MIERVESPADRRLDPYRQVGDPAWIRAHNLFVAEGRLVVERLLALGRFSIHSILVNRAAHDAMREPLSSSATTVFVCEDTDLREITGYNFHRGCLALVERPAAAGGTSLLASRRLLALEGVGNPDNVGGLFRTAAAFGVDGVLLDGTSGDPLYRKAIRTSMGATLRVPFARADDWLGTLRRFRDAGFRLVALTPSAQAEPLGDFAAAADPAARLLVLVGAEGPGLGDATLALADVHVRIPIDRAVDSLNVVVAAGIALHALSGMPSGS